MSFNEMLTEAEPREAAEAALAVADAIIADPKATEDAKENARRVLSLTADQLTDRIIRSRAGGAADPLEYDLKASHTALADADDNLVDFFASSRAARKRTRSFTHIAEDIGNHVERYRAPYAAAVVGLFGIAAGAALVTAGANSSVPTQAATMTTVSTAPHGPSNAVVSALDLDFASRSKDDQIGAYKFALNSDPINLGVGWKAKDSSGGEVAGAMCNMELQISGPENFGPQKLDQCSSAAGVAAWQNAIQLSKAGTYTVLLKDLASRTAIQQRIEVEQLGQMGNRDGLTGAELGSASTGDIFPQRSRPNDGPLTTAPPPSSFPRTP